MCRLHCLQAWLWPWCDVCGLVWLRLRCSVKVWGMAWLGGVVCADGRGGLRALRVCMLMLVLILMKGARVRRG